jgi:hypothetical protein
MDVILDSNQYVNNPKMTGVKFQSLFDYLRMSGGSLVIPCVVRDEVLARCEDALKREHFRTAQLLKGLAKRVFELAIPPLPNLDIAIELSRLTQKLQNPAPGITAIVGQDYADVSLQEVARRGINRTRPANDNGEELRDVIVWLATLAHAKRQKDYVGFISEDHSFQGPDSGLHPDLQDELAREGVKLHFATAIDFFVKAHSPSPKSVGPEWAAERLTSEQLAKIKGIFRLLAERTLAVGIPPLVVLSASEPILQFKSGRLFEISPGSVYAEVDYDGSSVLDVSEAAFYLSPSAYDAPSAAITAGQVPTPFQFEGREPVPGDVFPGLSIGEFRHHPAEVDRSICQFCAFNYRFIFTKVGAAVSELRRVLSDR